MPSPFTAEHDELRASIRAFVAEELRPHAAAWERDRWFPDDVFTRMGELGLLGLKVPEALGGRGGDHLHEAVLCEELARCGSGGLAAGIGAHVNIATPPVLHFGSPDLHERYVRPAVRGVKIAALGITEPGAGSDVAAIRTHAREVDGGWVVNGEKTYITNGVRADFVVTAVRTTREGGHGGISFLVVDRQEGMRSAALRKLGWHAGDTATIAYDDCFVPRGNLLGPLHGGFKLVMANFGWERLAMALGAVAAMQEAFELTLEAVRARGRAQQAVRHRLADLATRIYACRCVTYDALALFVGGAPCVQEVTMAKLATQRAAFEVTDACLGLHGGDTEDLERMVRDARLGPIGGGSDEIMREVLGRSLAG